ncbi:MAG: DUF58 domain-containing protein [Acidobacteriota bacterium]
MDAHSPWRGFLTAVAVLAGLLGFASGAPALVGFAFGWALLMALGVFASRFGLVGLVGQRRIGPNAFEGDLLTVDVVLENYGRRAARFVVASDTFGAGLADRQSVLEAGPLPSMHRRVLSYRAFVARQWGLYTVGPLSLGAWDPLGLVYASREIPRLDPFEVFPRTHEIESLSTQAGRATISPRDSTAAAAGQSLLFRGVRDFEAGDDVRRIHWPATARRGSPMVREFERDQQPAFVLFLDLDRRGRAGIGRNSTLEYLVRIGASILWTAYRRGDVLSLVAEGEREIMVPPGQDETHLATAMHELVRVRQRGTTSLLTVVDRHREWLPSGTTAVLLLANPDIDLDALSQTLQGLRAFAVRPLVVAVDTLQFPPVDRPPTPVEVARERREALRQCLVDLDVAATIVGPDETPEETLKRTDFLKNPPGAAS